MTDFLFALIGAALISYLLPGLLPGAAATRPLRLAALGPCAALVIALAVPLAWLSDYLLQGAGLHALYLVVFILLAAALATWVPRWLSRWRPACTQTGLWPILLGNALGAMLLARSLASPGSALVLGVAGGLGFWLMLQLLHDLQARIEQCDVPPAFRGAPLMLIGAGLTGLACLGFNGMGAL